MGFDIPYLLLEWQGEGSVDYWEGESPPAVFPLLLGHRRMVSGPEALPSLQIKHAQGTGRLFPCVGISFPIQTMCAPLFCLWACHQRTDEKAPTASSFHLKSQVLESTNIEKHFKVSHNMESHKAKVLAKIYFSINMIK
jgi:hypothetical protein